MKWNVFIKIIQVIVRDHLECLFKGLSIGKDSESTWICSFLCGILEGMILRHRRVFKYT